MEETDEESKVENIRYGFDIIAETCYSLTEYAVA